MKNVSPSKDWGDHYACLPSLQLFPPPIYKCDPAEPSSNAGEDGAVEGEDGNRLVAGGKWTQNI